MNYSFDLHLHSCLSPYGGEDMTPFNIASMCALAGYDIVALTDYNSCGNSAAFQAAAEAEGLLAGRGYRNFRVRLRPWGALLQFDDSQHADAENDMENIRGLLGGMFHELRLDPTPRTNGD